MGRDEGLTVEKVRRYMKACDEEVEQRRLTQEEWDEIMFNSSIDIDMEEIKEKNKRQKNYWKTLNKGY